MPDWNYCNTDFNQNIKVCAFHLFLCFSGKERQKLIDDLLAEKPTIIPFSDPRTPRTSTTPTKVTPGRKYSSGEYKSGDAYDPGDHEFDFVGSGNNYSERDNHSEGGHSVSTEQSFTSQSDLGYASGTSSIPPYQDGFGRFPHYNTSMPPPNPVNNYPYASGSAAQYTPIHQPPPPIPHNAQQGGYGQYGQNAYESAPPLPPLPPCPHPEPEPERSIPPHPQMYDEDIHQSHTSRNHMDTNRHKDRHWDREDRNWDRDKGRNSSRHHNRDNRDCNREYNNDMDNRRELRKRPKTPEPEEPKYQSLESRIQSLLKSQGIVSDETEPAKPEASPPPPSSSRMDDVNATIPCLTQPPPPLPPLPSDLGLDHSFMPSPQQDHLHTMHRNSASPSFNSEGLDHKNKHTLDFRDEATPVASFHSTNDIVTPGSISYISTPTVGDINTTPRPPANAENNEIVEQSGNDVDNDDDEDRMSLSSISSGEEKLEVNLSGTAHADNSVSWAGNYGNVNNFNSGYGAGMFNQTYYNQFQNNMLNAGTQGPNQTQDAFQRGVQDGTQKDIFDTTFMLTLNNCIKELKQVMQKDLCKKMIEVSAFKGFDSWWDGEEEKLKVSSMFLLICSYIFCFLL